MSVPMEWLRVDESTPLLGRKRKDASRVAAAGTTVPAR